MGYKNTKKVQYLVLVDKIKKSSKEKSNLSVALSLFFLIKNYFFNSSNFAQTPALTNKDFTVLVG